MNDDLFAELVESVREGGAILRGEKAPARQFEIDAVDIKNIRQQFDLSLRCQPPGSHSVRRLRHQALIVHSSR